MSLGPSLSRPSYPQTSHIVTNLRISAHRRKSIMHLQTSARDSTPPDPTCNRSKRTWIALWKECSHLTSWRTCSQRINRSTNPQALSPRMSTYQACTSRLTSCKTCSWIWARVNDQSWQNAAFPDRSKSLRKAAVAVSDPLHQLASQPVAGNTTRLKSTRRCRATSRRSNRGTPWNSSTNTSKKSWSTRACPTSRPV